jgi:hypothetical protein
MMKTKWLLNATVDDALSGVAKVEFYVDDVYVGNVSAPGPYVWHYQGHGKKAQAIVYDIAGNSAISLQISDYEPYVDSQPMPKPTVTQNDRLSFLHQTLEQR